MKVLSAVTVSPGRTLASVHVVSLTQVVTLVDMVVLSVIATSNFEFCFLILGVLYLEFSYITFGSKL